MDRRSLLATTGVILTTFTAGCNKLFPNHYSFDLVNASDTMHSFTIRIENTSREVIHDETYQMEGGTAKEDVSFEGIPARLFVRLDSADEQVFPWPASANEAGEIASRASIAYDMVRQREVTVLNN